MNYLNKFLFSALLLASATSTSFAAAAAAAAPATGPVTPPGASCSGSVVGCGFNTLYSDPSLAYYISCTDDTAPAQGRVYSIEVGGPAKYTINGSSPKTVTLSTTPVIIKVSSSLSNKDCGNPAQDQQSGRIVFTPLTAGNIVYKPYCTWENTSLCSNAAK